MTTTDSNGIIFLEETDPISPFHTLMNTMQQGTSDAITSAQVRPSGKVVRLGDQTVGNGSWTTITAWTTVLHSQAGVTFVSGRFRVPSDGIYLLTGDAAWDATNGGRRALSFSINGATAPMTETASQWASGAGGIHTPLSTIVELDANQTVGLMVWQNSGGNVAASTAVLSVTRIA